MNYTVFSKRDRLALASVLVLIYLFNYFIQSSGYTLLYHPINILYVSVLFLYRLNADKTFCVVLSIFYFVIFHQYGSDPYSEEFTNYLSGYYKLLVIFIFLSCFSFVRSISGGVLILLLIISSFLNATIYDTFRVTYLFNDIFFFILVSSIFFLKNNSVSREVIEDVILLFSLMLPFACGIVYLLELGTERYGSYIFFYGHLFLFLLVYPVFYFVRDKASLNIFLKILLLLNGVVFMLSAQSAQYLILIIIILLSILFSFNLKKLSFGLVVLVSFLFIISNIESGTWLSLKVNQLLALSYLNDLSAITEVNSLAIRVYELLIIFESNTTFQHLLGNGLGSIYIDSNQYFNYLNLHSATFSEAELYSGEYYLIHESLVKLFFIGGMFSLLIFFWRNLVNTVNFRKDPLYIAIIVYFVMLGLSGVQFSAFITMLYISTINSSGETCNSM